MQHEIGAELAGRRFGFHALDQLPTRRADHLDADERKLLAEFVDDLLLDLREGRRVEGELALLARGFDEAVGGLVGRCGARPPDNRETANAGGGGEQLSSRQSHSFQAPSSLTALTAGSRRSCSTRRAKASAASRTRRTSAPTPSRRWDRTPPDRAALSSARSGFRSRGSSSP